MRLLVALTLAFVTACGGSSDPRALTDEGSKALNSGHFEDAAKSYGEALAVLGTDTANPEWKRAKLGWIQAQTRIDAVKAKSEFLEYAQGSPSKVTDEDFNRVASRLGEAGKLKEATEILEVGKKMFPESLHLDALGKDLVQRAKSSGDTGALEDLKGLGYVGD